MGKKLLIAMLWIAGSFAASSPAYAGLVANGAAAQRVGSGYKVAEGPAVDAKGNVYFSDALGKRILKWTAGKGVTVHKEATDGTNGMRFGADGCLYVCEPWNHRVARYSLNGEITPIAESWSGGAFNQPNDLWLDPRGGVYFTDFEGAAVYYVTPARKTIRVIADLKGPNGIVGAPDGARLYVADYSGERVMAYDVAADGALTNGKTFIARASDGMALDAQDNLYLTGEKNVTIYNPAGVQLAKIAVPEATTNLAFAGSDRKTLFITTFTAAYTLAMDIPGAPTAQFTARPQKTTR